MKLVAIRRVVAICAAAAVVAIALSACGSSSSTSTSQALASASTGTTARFQARLNLAKCLRSHGLNVPDPTPGGGAAGGGGGVFRSLQNYPRSQVSAAMQACSQYLRQSFAFGNLSPAQVAQFRQEFVKFAQCMRSHGIDIPDPTANGAGGFGFRQALGKIDRNSPAFQSALQACQSLRPRFGRGGGGGAFGGGGGGAFGGGGGGSPSA